MRIMPSAAQGAHVYHTSNATSGISMAFGEEEDSFQESSQPTEGAFQDSDTLTPSQSVPTAEVISSLLDSDDEEIGMTQVSHQDIS
ncbi:hypothetical protein C0992_012389 [Termitomyces sp. T32_za158]|nr:hypothetical protein C0992_012389 [Termitomyces sp. T32_za158]